MKKIGQIMKELGFNPEASDSSKEAFLKFLIKKSENVHVQTPSEKKLVAENKDKIISFPEQLSFPELKKESEEGLLQA